MRTFGRHYQESAVVLCIFLLGVVPFICLIVLVGAASADTAAAVITADRLEYFHGTGTYDASGSVVIERGKTVLHADEATYREKTSEISVHGNVFYDDPDRTMYASEAELNNEKKTGRFGHAEIIYKKEGFRISGALIEKKDDRSYFSPDATFTTCIAPLPAWCVKGRSVDVLEGDRLTAFHGTIRIKGLPVLYVPYLWAPIITERRTGFLLPSFRYSDRRGLGVSIPFFWAVSGNRDATIVLTPYSRSGSGRGVEYRFIERNGIKGDVWAYNFVDTLLDKKFWELRGHVDYHKTDRLDAFVNINYVNDRAYYGEFGERLEIRAARYLESTAEISAPMQDSRWYLLSQYRVDLRETDNVLQRLPEAGYVRRYSRMGPFLGSVSADVAYFRRERGIQAFRADVAPSLLHSIGRDLVISQALSAAVSAYSFDRYAGRDTLLRTVIDYDISGNVRLYRKWGDLAHAIEPSVGYHLTVPSHTSLPVFDGRELSDRASVIELSILSRGFVRGQEMALFRASQRIDTRNSGHPFLPLALDLALRGPLPLTVEAHYNVEEGRVDAVSSELGLPVGPARLSLGQRYNRAEKLTEYKTGLSLDIARRFRLSGEHWYDAERKISSLSGTMVYTAQCWGIGVEAIKTSVDYAYTFFFEIPGLMGRSPQFLPLTFRKNRQ